MLAKGQQQFEQAEQYYRQALQIFIEFNDRHSQAITYHMLGMVAKGQQQFEQAEQYYRQALQIFIEFNDRHSQAITYHMLGRAAEEQQQWDKAREHFLCALEIYFDFQDTRSGGIVLYSLARVWWASGDMSITTAVSSILGVTLPEAETLLKKVLEDNSAAAND
jgi:tetratricopeptide (TPR) repeat protein